MMPRDLTSRSRSRAKQNPSHPERSEASAFRPLTGGCRATPRPAQCLEPNKTPVILSTAKDLLSPADKYDAEGSRPAHGLEPNKTPVILSAAKDLLFAG